MIFFRGQDLNDLISQLFAFAQEEDGKNWNHYYGAETHRRGSHYFFERAVDIRALAFEEGPDLISSLVAPAKTSYQVVCDLSRRNFCRQRRDCRENSAGVLAKFRNETVEEQHGHDDDCEIGFQNMGSSQASEKQRVPLQESDKRVNQIREQNRKGKNDDNGAGDVDDSQRYREKQRG